MASPSPLRAYIRVQQPIDAEMRRLLRDAANEAEKIVLSYGDKETFDKVRMRRAVADLRRLNHETFGRASGITAKGVREAARAAALSETFFSDVLKKRFGSSLIGWERAIGYSAENGIRAVMAKRANAIPLARSVYRAEAWAADGVQHTVSKGLLLQKSARQIASDVKKFVNPSTPGGTSYAAQRLARTEINNAFHAQQIASRKKEPWTEAFLWNLSGSHKRPDECNRYAETVHEDGQKAGIFSAEKVPGKPHPNCLCYLTTVTISEDEFIDGLLSGKFDRFVNGEMRRGGEDGTVSDFLQKQKVTETRRRTRRTPRPRSA